MGTIDRAVRAWMAPRGRTARALAWVGLCAVAACSDGGDETGGAGHVASPVGAGQGATGGPAAAGQAGTAGIAGVVPAAGASGGAAQPAPAGSDEGPGQPPSTSDDAAATPIDAGAAGDAAIAGDAATEPAPSTGPLLPPVDDPGDSGSFEIQVVDSLEGLSTHIMIAPAELGRDGLEHPVLVWINGAGASSSSYRNMHDNLAAHGFVIVDDKQSTFEAIPEIDSQRAAIDWVVEQTQDSAGPYFGKFDETRIAIGGHSLGSVASFGNVADPRISTSVHMAGGVIGNPGGVDNSLIDALRVPTLFLCGSADSNGLGRVQNDFASAPPDVPLFFGTLDGVGHTDEFNQTNGGRWGRIVTAWLRWRLADDASAAALFTGDDCEFCTGDWTTMKRALD